MYYIYLIMSYLGITYLFIPVFIYVYIYVFIPVLIHAFLYLYLRHFKSSMQATQHSVSQQHRKVTAERRSSPSACQKPFCLARRMLVQKVSPPPSMMDLFLQSPGRRAHWVSAVPLTVDILERAPAVHQTLLSSRDVFHRNKTNCTQTHMMYCRGSSTHQNNVHLATPIVMLEEPKY